MNSEIQSNIDTLISQANQVILGKDRVIRLAVSTLLANGHLLITDKPGVGKTTLANVLARLFGLNFKRIQFTSDLLPADITGVTIFDQETSAFTFHPGPIFAQLVLADEINRATPKCQSALLEAMEERQVTIDRKTRPLPNPFFVIATRNPSEQSGTFSLPDSQLDRFMLGISLGYPHREAERDMLRNPDPRTKLGNLLPVFSSQSLALAQSNVDQVIVSNKMLDYLQAVIEFTRTDPAFRSGYSPRAGMSLLDATKGWAVVHGRNHVLPEDLQAIVPYSIHHLSAREPGTNLGQIILDNVAIP
ncbi:MAG: AAA family ATPase [Gammaproteobacteria bacterium]